MAATSHVILRSGSGLAGLFGLALFIAAAVYGYHLLNKIVEYTDARKATRIELMRATRVMSLLKDIETGQRGYALTGDSAYLQPYIEARRSLPGELEALGLGMRALPPGPSMARFGAAIDRKLRLSERRVATRRDQGLAKVVEATQDGTAKAAMDQIRLEFAGLENHLNRHIDYLDDQVGPLRRRASIAGAGLAAGGAALLLLAYMLVLREHKRRIEAEQRLTVAAVAETEARAQAQAQGKIVDILESLLDGFVALDRDWRYVYVNAQAGRLLGRAPRDLIGSNIWTLFPEGIDQPFARAYRRVMSERHAETLIDYYAPWDRWFENRIFPTQEGIAIYFHEITEQKRAQAEAARRGAELESVFDALPDLFFRLAGDGTILDYRARRDELYVAPENFLGKRMQDVLPADVGARFAAMLAEAGRAPGLRGFEYALDMPRGPRQYEARLNRLSGESDLIVVVRDITDRVAADQALRQARDDLRDFLGKLDRDMEFVRKRLARDVHDQIGQIFTALKLRMLTCKTSTALDAESIAECDALLDEGIRVARRISADLRPALLDDLGLGPALAHHAKLLAQQAPFSIESTVDADARLDAEQSNQLFRVAMEALSNVARHAQAKHARIVGRLDNGHYLLSVEDDGVSWPADKQHGLGIVGMRERSAQIGAELILDRSPMGGARVAVRLPLIEKEAADAYPERR